MTPTPDNLRNVKNLRAVDQALDCAFCYTARHRGGLTSNASKRMSVRKLSWLLAAAN
jgi:hypothetical protein